MRSRAWLVVILVLILTACTSNNQATLPDADVFVNEGQVFGLRIGDTAAVFTVNGFVVVRFSWILEDDRCPGCADPGSALIVLSVQTALAVQDVEIQVPPGEVVDQPVAEVTVRVQELRPETPQGSPPDPLQYAVILSVRTTGTILPTG